jgi:hypothetical protein
MFRTVSRRMAFLLISLVMSFAVPLGIALASHQYSDVPDSNPFHGDITAITNAGVTSGCGGGKYCPDRNVTRAEMAAFMNRLGALASNKTPIVNATTVDRYNAADINRLSYTSHAAPTVDGDAASTGRLTTTITTPGWGYLMITGSAYVYNEASTSTDDANCWLEVDNDEVPGSNRWVDTHYDTSVAGRPLIDEVNCASSGGYLVCDAATYTVDFEFGSIGADLNIQDSSLMVEYVPFNGSGSTPFLPCLIIVIPHNNAHAPSKAP